MNKKILTILILFAVVIFAGAQNLEERYLSKANQEYQNKNYLEAYKYINFVFDIHDGEELPLPAKILGEKIYYHLEVKLEQDNNFEYLDDISLRLNKFPELSSVRITELFSKIKDLRTAKEEKVKVEQEKARKAAEEKARIEAINKALEKERAAQAQQEAIRAEERRIYEEKEKVYQAKLDLLNQIEKEKAAQQQEKLESIHQAELARNKEQQDALRADMANTQEKELQRLKQYQEDRARYEQRMIALISDRDSKVADQQQEFNDLLKTSIKDQNSSSSTNEKMSLYVVILIAVIGLFLFLGFGLLIFLSIRHSQDNQRRFENTLYTMQSTRPITSINNQYALPDVTESIEHFQLEDNSGQKALPSPDDESEKIKEMLQNCKKYGEQINLATNRKNNSRNTSELVYKISKELGYDEKECVLHFAIGMIYDIGFLSINPDILALEQLSEEQFGIVQSHVNLGLNMIYFVDKQYQPLFRDGILKHHENLDGSGYPSGLKDTEIPYIARVLHVVESFMSLISSRNYKAILDREAAIEKLMEETDKYDLKIMEALNAIV